MHKQVIVFRIAILFMAAFLATCNSDTQQIGCTKDIDCKNDRICEMGACVNPSMMSQDTVTEGFEPGGEFDTGGGSECDLTAAMDPNAIVVDVPLMGDITITSWPNDTPGSTHAAGTTGECAWDLVAGSDTTVYSPVSGTVVGVRNTISDSCHYTYKCCNGGTCKCSMYSGKQCGSTQDVSTCDCTSLYALVAANVCSTCSSSYGNYIVIEPDQAKGNYLMMAHLAENSMPSTIKVGSKVCQGTPIARMGTTGNSTGHHVHYALTKETSGSFASIPMALRYKTNAASMAMVGVPREKIKITSALSKQQCINSCSDGIKNGTETSIDCGGSSCSPCADGLNCAMNSDCINGYCSSNVCSSGPQILVDKLADPFDLALDSGNIYWIEKRVSGGALRKVPKIGGSVVTLSTNLAEPTAVIVDANYAYVLERNNGSNGMIHRIPLGGGSAELVVGGLTNSQNNLVQAGNNLYWGDYVLGTGGVIKSAPKGANVASTVVAQGNGLLNLQTALDTDGMYLYIRNDSNQMLRFPIGGGSPSILGATGTSSFLSSIRVSAGSVYFTGDNLVGAIPSSGGAMRAVTTATSPSTLAVDSSYVYFMEYSSSAGNVQRAAVGGGSVKTYYPQAGSIGLEVDATHVYWITSLFANQGKVMRAPK